MTGIDMVWHILNGRERKPWQDVQIASCYLEQAIEEHRRTETERDNAKMERNRSDAERVRLRRRVAQLEARLGRVLAAASDPRFPWDAMSTRGQVWSRRKTGRGTP